MCIPCIPDALVPMHIPDAFVFQIHIQDTFAHIRIPNQLAFMNTFVSHWQLRVQPHRSHLISSASLRRRMWAAASAGLFLCFCYESFASYVSFWDYAMTASSACVCVCVCCVCMQTVCRVWMHALRFRLFANTHFSKPCTILFATLPFSSFQVKHTFLLRNHIGQANY